MAVQTYVPESYFPDFVYIPSFFKPSQVTYNLKDFQLETDSTGRTSIIKLTDSDGNKVTPFIDLSKYDTEVKDWYWYNQLDYLPYRYRNNSMVNLVPTTCGQLTQLSLGALKFDDALGVWVETTRAYNDPQGLYTVFYKYSPLLVVGNNVPFTDFSDYASNTVTDNLDYKTSNPQFYYDFEDRIYTNKDLLSYSANDIKIKLYTVGTNEVSLKCIMNANSGGQARVTPVVDDYILKLKGQFLRS